MNLRHHLRAAGATLAAAGLALAPAAQASTPGTAANYVSVGGSSAAATYGLTGILQTGGSVTLKVYGANSTLNCASGSFAGSVHAGPTGGVTYKAISMTSLSLNCDTFMPGRTVTISVPATGCAGFKVNDTTVGNTTSVHDGLVDTGPKGAKFAVVNGYIDIPYPACPVTVTTSGGCTLQLGNRILAQFDEAIKPNGTQDLVLKGSDLTIKSMLGACLGAYSVGQTITMNNFRFNVTTNGGAGAIDFRTNP